MNSFRHPSGTTSPRPADAEPSPAPHTLLGRVVATLTTRPQSAGDVLRANWHPDINILSTQPINETRETTHV